MDFKEIASAFVVLFAIIDITGSIPVIIDLKARNKQPSAGKVSLLSFIILFLFLFIGEAILRLFGVDVSSFAVAGSLIIFIIALEMVLDVQLFKDKSPSETSYLVPLVFPLIAGAGSFTTLLSLRAEFAIINIIIALALNILFVYFVLKSTTLIERVLGKGGIYVLRKFFGIILLAVAVKLFTANLEPTINKLSIAIDLHAIKQIVEQIPLLK
jgi:multiple antibiotic resistance protein